MQEKLLERILLPVDIVLAITFIILIVLNITTKPSSNIPESISVGGVNKQEDIDYTTEDDADADDSVTTRQFNNSIRNDIHSYLNMVNQYQANNRGAIPATADDWNSFNKNYLDAEFMQKYKFTHCDNEEGNCTLPSALTWANNANMIYTASHASCSNNNIVYTNGKRKIAIYIHLKGETNGVYCLGN